MDKISRRDALVGAAAVVATTSLMAPVLAAPEPPEMVVWRKIKATLGVVPGSDLDILFENLRRETVALMTPRDPLYLSRLAALNKVMIPVTLRIYHDLLAGKLFPLQAMRDKTEVIDGIEVTAQERTLSARWTSEHADQYSYDGPPPVGIDIEAEIMAALAQEIGTEINQEHLRYFRRHAAHGPGVLRGDDVFEAVHMTATAMSPRGNWAVISPTTATHAGLVGVGETYLHHIVDPIFDYTGPDGHKVTYYLDPYASDMTPILVGHNGSEESAVTFAPYLLMITGGVLIDPTTMEPIVSFNTHYAMHADETKMQKQFTTMEVDYPTLDGLV